MNVLENFNAAQLQIRSRGGAGLIRMCVCLCLRAHMCTHMVSIKMPLLATCVVWIDSYTLDPYLLDSRSERPQPCISLCLGGIFLLKDQIQRNGPPSSTNC